MSHRPWESPGRALQSSSPSTSNRQQQLIPPPPPPPPPQPPPSSSSNYAYQLDNTLPPISSPSRNPVQPNKRRRQSTTSTYVPPDPPPLPASAALFSPLQGPPPFSLHHLSPQPPPQPPRPRPSHSRYPSESALSHIVAQVYNVVQDLTQELDTPPPGHGHPPPPPRHHPVAATELTSLDAVVATLDAVFQALKPRVGNTHPKHPRTLHMLNSPTTSTTVTTTTTTTAASLQNQINTLTLERETARKDSSHLLTRLSRAEKRASMLDNKVTSLVLESEAFERERERLLGNVEVLEETLDEIRTERNDLRDEMLMSRKQWGTIMVNAGRIEGALVREVGECRRILEEGDGGGCCVKEDEGLRHENEKLRRRVRVLEKALEKLQASSGELRGLSARLVALGKDMDMQATAVGLEEEQDGV